MPKNETLLLVYDADSGLRAKLLDAVKKAVGREECALCEITYSPVGKRRAWTACEARLGLPVRELHRDEVPAAWGIDRSALPCILLQSGAAAPTVLLHRSAIQQCGGDVEVLEAKVVHALAAARSAEDVRPAGRGGSDGGAAFDPSRGIERGR